jgi:plastocyanin
MGSAGTVPRMSHRRLAPHPLRIAAAGGVLLVGAATLVACSNGSTVAAKRAHPGRATATASANGVQQVTITTGNDLRFHPSTIVVHPGKVTVTLDNTAKAGTGPPHNFSFMGMNSQLAAAGDKVQYSFIAPAPGTYSFVCTLHVEQGQTGTLVVTS